MKTMKKEALYSTLMIALSLILLYLGWKIFWFLTDDAFIAFRYVSNRIAGYGYVWNRPPFLPVEGYTSFLWIIILDFVWTLFGVQPPESANWISLGFSCATLVLSSLMLLRLKWTEHLKKAKVVFLGLFLFFILSNRTFLAWTSSGLETAMFCFFITAWVYSIVFVKEDFRRILLGGFCCTAIALTRPDGSIYCIATVIIALILVLQTNTNRPRRFFRLLGLAPLTIVLLHLLWRIKTYGELVPNTYFAKVVSPWPHSGLTYALSFVLEYGLWLLIALMIYTVSLVVIEYFRNLRSVEKSTQPMLLKYLPSCNNMTLLIVSGTLLAHMAYYTLIVGGDHFEYRVYNQIVPFIFICLIWCLNRVNFPAKPAVLFAVAVCLGSLPVPWTHWALTHNINTRPETQRMHVPIAPSWPKYLRWYADYYDEKQAWMILRSVCRRHQEHKIFGEFQLRSYPSREEGSEISGKEFPVFPVASVGVPAWIFPNVNIIDIEGLNDYVIARTPLPEKHIRSMAHDRTAPKGYVESFKPTMKMTYGTMGYTIVERDKPLTSEDIINIEKYWREKIHKNELAPPK